MGNSSEEEDTPPPPVEVPLEIQVAGRQYVKNRSTHMIPNTAFKDHENQGHILDTESPIRNTFKMFFHNGLC